MYRKIIAGALFICSIFFFLTGAGTIGASSVVSTASSPETMVVTISTNDYTSSSPSGAPSVESGTISFGTFVGEERSINEAVKVNVKSNGQWSMQIQADPMTSSIPGEEHIQLPAEQFQKRVAIGLGSDTNPSIAQGMGSYGTFDYNAEGEPLNRTIIENADATGDFNGTQISIGLKTLLTFADPAREYQSLITVTTTASY